MGPLLKRPIRSTKFTGAFQFKNHSNLSGRRKIRAKSTEQSDTPTEPSVCSGLCKGPVSVLVLVLVLVLGFIDPLSWQSLRPPSGELVDFYVELHESTQQPKRENQQRDTELGRQTQRDRQECGGSQF